MRLLGGDLDRDGGVPFFEFFFSGRLLGSLDLRQLLDKVGVLPLELPFLVRFSSIMAGGMGSSLIASSNA